MSQAHTQAESQRRELTAFRIAEQEYCVDIMSVREIRGWSPATALPHTPSYVLGVINLRGAVLPIMDLAARLGLPLAIRSTRKLRLTAEGEDYFARGKQILKDSGLPIISANNMAEAAERVVAAAKGN